MKVVGHKANAFLIRVEERRRTQRPIRQNCRTARCNNKLQYVTEIFARQVWEGEIGRKIHSCERLLVARIGRINRAYLLEAKPCPK